MIKIVEVLCSFGEDILEISMSNLNDAVDEGFDIIGISPISGSIGHAPRLVYTLSDADKPTDKVPSLSCSLNGCEDRLQKYGLHKNMQLMIISGALIFQYIGTGDPDYEHRGIGSIISTVSCIEIERENGKCEPIVIVRTHTSDKLSFVSIDNAKQMREAYLAKLQIQSKLNGLD